MTRRDDFDRRLSGWMAEAASGTAPSGGFDRAMAASARRRPLPRVLASVGSDWPDILAPRRIEVAWPSGQRHHLAPIGIAVLVLLAIVGAAVVGALLLRPDPSILPSAASNGWVAFSLTDDVGPDGEPLRDIYLVSESSPPRRIIGVDGDDRDDYCPTFSPDGRQLAYVGGRVSLDSAHRGYGLVVASINARGQVTETRTIPVVDAVEPACPVWSPDGRRIALLIPSVTRPQGYRPDFAGVVWLMTVATDAATLMPGVPATDLEWSPDSSELAVVRAPEVASLPLPGGPVVIYPVEGGVSRTVPGVENVVSLDWSPDGSRIAYQRTRTPATISPDGGMLVGSELQEIWTVAPDGTEPALQTPPFEVNHGVGPAWSPAGDRIVYQRLCATNPVRPSMPCREEHEAVVLIPGSAIAPSAPVGQETVVPLTRLEGAGGPGAWLPWAIAWSPDGRTLLYSAWGDPFDLDQPVSRGFVVVDPDAVVAPRLLYEGAGVHTGSWGAKPVE